MGQDYFYIFLEGGKTDTGKAALGNEVKG